MPHHKRKRNKEHTKAKIEKKKQAKLNLLDDYEIKDFKNYYKIGFNIQEI